MRSEIVIAKLAIMLVISALIIFSFIIKETYRSLPFPASSQLQQGQQQQQPEHQTQSQQQTFSTSAGLSINRSLDILSTDDNTAGQNSLTITGSFGDDQITGNDATNILLGLLGEDTYEVGLLFQ